MNERHFASWVESVAKLLAADRADVRTFASGLPPELWDKPSEVYSWTNKHILAHLAGGNDQLVRIILRKVIAREPLDASLLNVDTDAENAARIEERISWPIADLLAALDSEGDNVQDLLSQLTEDDRDYRGGGFPMTLSQFLQIVEHERHDAIHLVQLRHALESGQ